MLAAVAHAQPTSIAGITPGETTLETLKTLITEPQKIDNADFQIVNLIGLDKKMAYTYSKNGVIYRVEFPLSFEQEIKLALISKYGNPKRKQGSIKKVTCQNRLGASFERFEGEERIFWEPKTGIQAYLQRSAHDCASDIYEKYIIEHIQTAKSIEAEKAAERTKKLLDNVNKAKDNL